MLLECRRLSLQGIRPGDELQRHGGESGQQIDQLHSRDRDADGLEGTAEHDKRVGVLCGPLGECHPVMDEIPDFDAQRGKPLLALRGIELGCKLLECLLQLLEDGLAQVAEQLCPGGLEPVHVAVKGIGEGLPRLGNGGELLLEILGERPLLFPFLQLLVGDTVGLKLLSEDRALALAVEQVDDVALGLESRDPLGGGHLIEQDDGVGHLLGIMDPCLEHGRHVDLEGLHHTLKVEAESLAFFHQVVERLASLSLRGGEGERGIDRLECPRHRNLGGLHQCIKFHPLGHGLAEEVRDFAEGLDELAAQVDTDTELDRIDKLVRRLGGAVQALGRLIKSLGVGRGADLDCESLVAHRVGRLKAEG